MKTLILGLGNELLSDDGAGILVARSLQQRLRGKADIFESSLSGLALLDFFIGYHRAIVIDAVKTDHFPLGTIRILNLSDLDSVPITAPHYVGLPEMLTIAKRLDLDFPDVIKIFTLEVSDPYTIGGKVSKPVESAIENIIPMIEEQVQSWEATYPVV